MTHTRSTLHKLLPSIHESFRDNKRNPILTIVEDTSPGIHDVLFAACFPERYLQLGADKEHNHCAKNLHDAIEQCTEPSFNLIMKFLESGWVPDPLNLFMKVDIHGNILQCLNPESKAGDYIVLKAEQECIMIMSACPMDLSACNGSEPSSAKFEVI